MTDQFHLDDICVAPDVSLMDAIKALTAAARKIILVVDVERHLLGVVTDYDVRNAILNHVGFDEPVSAIMKKKPIVASSDATEAEIVANLKKERVAQLPITDKDGTLVDIRFIEDYQHIEEHHSERVAVIMAGGLGTRLRPATEQVPKPLLEVDGQPILFILIDQLLNERFDKIYVTLNYLSEMIIASINAVPRFREKVEFVIESEAQGTAGSLTLLPDRPESPFLVINGDLVTNVSLQDMLSHHHAEGNAVTLATKRHSYDLPYGIADIEGTRILKLREKPSFNYFINTGVYVVEPSVLDRLPDGKPIDMTDVVQDLLDADERVGSFAVHEYWIDIGTHDKYEQAQKDYPIHFPKSGK